MHICMHVHTPDKPWMTHTDIRTYQPRQTHVCTDMQITQMNIFSKQACTNKGTFKEKPTHIMKWKRIQQSLKPIWCWRKVAVEKSYLIRASKQPTTARALRSKVKRQHQTNLCCERNKRFHVFSSKDHTLIHSTVRLIKALKLCVCVCVHISQHMCNVCCMCLCASMCVYMWASHTHSHICRWDTRELSCNRKRMC